ncbi:hypothetical protein PVL29_016861 [Vitis rotundifolia]|uniref:Protein disulfide isomerase-like 1-4 n=1 Tax=Vitis rotundifolia TaxID=103349 RepID=A0AA38ZA08_VITRO|nr:hypothetical protein PVL29_016861 [Vitis rotundifolia]
MAGRVVMILSILILLPFVAFSLSKADEPEDLTLLQSQDQNDAVFPPPDPNRFNGGGDDDDLSDSDGAGGDNDSDREVVDEKDVVVLKETNFSEFLERNPYVMVEFYAPWCGHCKALAPDYAAAATELKGEAVLAKVDGTEESGLMDKYEVQGFPTLYFYADGVHKAYSGLRTKDAIVAWVKKKMESGIRNITTTVEAESILTTESKIVLGFLDSLEGPESQELAAASRLEDDVNFYQTASPEVAKLFHIDQQVKRPALVLLKKEAEKLSHFDGQFIKSTIAEFVFANKHPLVIIFTKESSRQIFENPIKKQLLLFATSKDSENVLPKFQEAAKAFKGKLIFVYVEMDNKDGKSVADYFGVTGDAPRVLAYTGNDDAKKYVLDGELTLTSIKSFGKDFLEDKLKRFYKSDPIPETNDGDVKIVVGDNFDELVLDESKDVLLEIYDPSCGYCQALEPTYNKLAKYLRGIDSLVIAKMDGTKNEHPRAKTDGFPTILFFPAGNKSFDPITFDGDRTLVAFYKFLKKYASIPFKLKKPASYQSSKGAEAKDGNENNNSVKDEL